MRFKVEVPVEVELEMKDIIKRYILEVRVPKTYVDAARINNVNVLLNTIKNVAAGIGVNIKFEVEQ